MQTDGEQRLGAADNGNTTERINASLASHGDGIDMNVPAKLLESHEVYRGAIFRVEDTLIGLTTTSGSMVTIRRQVLRHAPCVVMLVHDTATDRYLIEREYRIGNDSFAYGLPAGLMDKGEDVHEAALRELREETGVTPISNDRMRIDQVTDCYSSEGMTDELAHIMVIHLDGFQQGGTPLRRGRTRGIGMGELARPSGHAHNRQQLHHRNTTRANPQTHRRQITRWARTPKPQARHVRSNRLRYFARHEKD